MPSTKCICLSLHSRSSNNFCHNGANARDRQIIFFPNMHSIDLKQPVLMSTFVSNRLKKKTREPRHKLKPDAAGNKN